MINIGFPQPVGPSKSTRKTRESERVSDPKQSSDSPKIPITDRRRNKERRNHRENSVWLDLRSGKDRRRAGKNRKGSAVDIKA